MTRPGIAALVACALLSPSAHARIEVRDSTWEGAAVLVVRPVSDDATGNDVADLELALVPDRGVPSASLSGRKGPRWTFWDRNPFARSGSDLVPLIQPPRILEKALVLPKRSPAGAMLAKTRRLPTPLPRVGQEVRTSSTDTSPAVHASVAPIPTEAAALPPAPETADMADSEPSPAAAPGPVLAAPREKPASKVSDIDGPDGIFTVVIDAGHGGKDPGAIGQKIGGKQIQEKDATLGIAQLLRDELKGRKGLRVVMTRDSDIFLSLGDRTRLANKADGDLFISIHCNSLPLNSPRRDDVEGFMVYLLREAKSEEDRAIERRENEAIRFETGERQRKDALSPVEWMLLEHQLNQFTKESERFAGHVVRRLGEKGPVKKERTGAGQAGFFVLVGALMPSVLIETGYVSHPDDAADLGSTSGRKAIAREIARAVDDFRRSRD